MNYPWGFTGGASGETAFWTSFAWVFDDVELSWMRHADRADVIFGGRDWIGNNLSEFLSPATNAAGAPVEVILEGPSLVDASEPVVVSIAVVNNGPVPIAVPRDLSPESGRVRVYIERPDGQIVEHRPSCIGWLPPRTLWCSRLVSGTSPRCGSPSPRPARSSSILVEYRVRALVTPDASAMLPSNVGSGSRIR